MKRTLVLALVLCCWCHAADAVDLHWDPGLLALAPGETGTLAIMIDEPIAIRTIDVVVEGDPALLTSMEASPGALYEAVSCFVWPESEELEPGRWHGFAVTIGSDCWVTGPGELLRWSFTAGDEGGTLVPAIEVTLYDDFGDIIPDASLGYTVVLVSATTEVDVPAPLSPRLEVSPNPFNPATSVRFNLEEATTARVDVFDLGGRLVSHLHDGTLGAGEHSLRWTGIDDEGSALPSGSYLFRLEVPGCRPVVEKGCLLR